LTFIDRVKEEALKYPEIKQIRLSLSRLVVDAEGVSPEVTTEMADRIATQAGLIVHPLTPFPGRCTFVLPIALRAELQSDEYRSATKEWQSINFMSQNLHSDYTTQRKKMLRRAREKAVKEFESSEEMTELRSAIIEADTNKHILYLKQKALIHPIVLGEIAIDLRD
jgi:hypothetical protein